ncbi:hypothetical protein JOF48_000899 [Arthrobacter stackebrandtii]|uniref:Uncharacterized protein n=1 Tax=Arthrobacter stackebrandtii TaxID=272161 RepID=A0ABS4YUE9_9MICC|nr:hypothetical protein [Arthrobacter stackebrandtii]MBP2412100.1 hypothetical protein [Arthrobacter stackebrandtii]PYH01905.1 hypothetical protein CVV67_00140 [Arthrobacter stackebrandtii]
MFKGLFGAAKQAKRDDAELGKGVWRRAHDRFRRGLDRFHQMLEGLAEAAPAAGQAPESARDNYAAMVQLADGLADLLPEVRSIAMEAQKTAPSDGLEVPLGTGGYLNDVHRELSKAGTALAAAAEALALVRLGAGEVSGVGLKAEIVHRHVARAGALLHKTAATGE